MALAPLATAADLTDRQIDASDTSLASTMLAVASAEVRGAAGSPISEADSTVALTGWWGEQWLRLPGPPVREVASVDLDGTGVADWRLVGARLWRRAGWGTDDGPCPVEVSYTHGLVEVPADIVDLVCSYAAAGMNAATTGGYEARSGEIAERIDDYSVQYAQGAEAVATVMTIPPATRARLRAMFGASAGMVTHR